MEKKENNQYALEWGSFFVLWHEYVAWVKGHSDVVGAVNAVKAPEQSLPMTRMHFPVLTEVVILTAVLIDLKGGSSM